MIAPLIDDSLDPAKWVRLRREIAENNDLSYKTVKRYDDAFRLGGFEGTISSSFLPFLSLRSGTNMTMKMFRPPLHFPL